jgi:hypothetical protein
MYLDKAVTYVYKPYRVLSLGYLSLQRKTIWSGTKLDSFSWPERHWAGMPNAKVTGAAGTVCDISRDSQTICFTGKFEGV